MFLLQTGQCNLTRFQHLPVLQTQFHQVPPMTHQKEQGLFQSEENCAVIELNPPSMILLTLSNQKVDHPVLQQLDQNQKFLIHLEILHLPICHQIVISTNCLRPFTAHYPSMQLAQKTTQIPSPLIKQWQEMIKTNGLNQQRNK